MTTSAVLWGVGDLAAQRLEHWERVHHRRGAPAAAAKPSKLDWLPWRRGRDAEEPPPPPEWDIDWRRALLTAVYGATFVGPVGHFWCGGGPSNDGCLQRVNE
jgi:hypothetical protein